MSSPEGQVIAELVRNRYCLVCEMMGVRSADEVDGVTYVDQEIEDGKWVIREQVKFFEKYNHPEFLLIEVVVNKDGNFANIKAIFPTSLENSDELEILRVVNAINSDGGGPSCAYFDTRDKTIKIEVSFSFAGSDAFLDGENEIYLNFEEQSFTNVLSSVMAVAGEWVDKVSMLEDEKHSAAHVISQVQIEREQRIKKGIETRKKLFGK